MRFKRVVHPIYIYGFDSLSRIPIPVLTPDSASTFAKLSKHVDAKSLKLYRPFAGRDSAQRGGASGRGPDRGPMREEERSHHAQESGSSDCHSLKKRGFTALAEAFRPRLLFCVPDDFFVMLSM